MGTVFGARLRELREARKLTQAELARLCQLGESTISFYESGKREPNYEVLLRLAEKLDTSPNYLLGIEDDPQPPQKNNAVVDLEQFIREHSIRIFGDRLDDDAKEDVLTALRAIWKLIKKERAAEKQP